MNLEVLLTEHAERDLKQIIRYIAEHDSPARARYVLAKIEGSFSRLSDYPSRGAYPPELSALGIREFREVFFKPYRIIYRVIGSIVYVTLIADGRRDMRAILERRFLE